MRLMYGDGYELRRLVTYDQGVERAFVSSFLTRSARLRAEALAHARQRRARAKYVAVLLDLRNYQHGLYQPVDGPHPLAAHLLARLRQMGAPEACYAISENSAMDGVWVPLAEALSRTVGFGVETLLLCVPDRLAFVETELTDRGILFRSR